jgi:UDP-N-acetylmuramyl pentapeptide phosphotransferase/UDP-N-acetylglucosamine-1-phosphate transferase
LEIINFNLTLVLFFFTILLIYVCEKFKILIDNNYFKHKNFVNGKKKPPAVGGIIILTTILLISQNIILKLILFGLFLLGIFADLRIIKKTVYRLIIQSILIILYILVSNIVVQKISFHTFDFFLENKFFSVLFTFICLVVLINGSNFVDGVNNLLSGYYLLVLSCILYLKITSNLIIDIEYYYNLIIPLFIIYFFNMFNKIYLGDSGSYLLSFLVGILLIKLKNQNLENISVFFIILLLWYPAFENLFSILRKIITKKKVYAADNDHIHHLIFCFLKKKLKINNETIISSLTGNVINLYNLLIFLLSVNFVNSSKYLVSIIVFNIFLYTFIYYILFLKEKKNKKFT